jgi:hypothetical protein|tara:strand:+ start:483 stop:686 length:204 start_codon:yes stop_codon:yes gene_type:complete
MKLILLVLAKPLLGLIAYNLVAFDAGDGAELKVEIAPKRLDHLENAPPAVDLPPFKQEDQETKPEKE